MKYCSHQTIREIRDHCHLIDRYRDPAHSNCKLNYKNSFYSIVLHNLSSYDAHFIIEEIATAYDEHVEVLSIIKEKYISFTKHVQDTTKKESRNYVKLKFIDLYKFLSTCLEKLARISTKIN